MAKKHQKLSFFTKLNLVTLLLVFASVVITGIMCLHYALSAKQNDMDSSIADVAAMVSSMPDVQANVEAHSTNLALQSTLDNLISSLSQIDILVICDTDSRRLYHTNKDRIGETFFGGDEGPILDGAEPYISVATGTMGLQRRAFHAITDDHGTIIGFVMASVLNSSLSKMRSSMISTFTLVLLLILSVTFIIVAIFRYSMERIFHGYNPEQFADLYIERAEVLDTLEEGLFAINTEGKVTLMNQSAKRMLDIPADTVTEGHLLQDYYPETQLPNTVKTGKAQYNINFVINHHNIISSRIPISKNGKIIGAVSIFRDKTEVSKLAEKLTGANTMVDTLRAFNHEFMNKLHVILGLLEMNETDKAKDYILGTSLVSGQAVSDIHKRVPIAGIAALLIGKLVRASELGITFVLKSDSYFYEKNNTLPTDACITIIGNLIENAMDELNSREFEEKQIELGIYSEEGHTVIVCDDTGGIPEEVLFSIYDKHTTTKGEGHGSGLYLIRQIVDAYEGTIHIDTELGEGTSIEVILPV